MEFDCLKPRGDSREVDIVCGGWQRSQQPKGKKGTNVLEHTKSFTTSASITFIQNKIHTLQPESALLKIPRSRELTSTYRLPPLLRQIQTPNKILYKTHTKNIRRLPQSQYHSFKQTSQHLDLRPEY